MGEYNKGGYSGQGDCAGNGAPDLFLAVHIAPPAECLDEVQFLFTPGTKCAEGCNLSAESLQLRHFSSSLLTCHHIFWGFSHWQIWTWDFFRGSVLFLSLLFTCLINSVVSALFCGPYLFCSLSSLFCTSSLSHISLVFFLFLSPLIL